MYEELGLGSEAGAVYGVMLAEGVTGRQALSDRLALTSAQVGKALDRLAEAGLVRPSLDRTGELLPADPQAGLGRLLADRQDRLLRTQREFDRACAAVTRLLADFAVAGPGGACRDMERLTGRDTVVARLGELADAAAFECLSLQPPPRGDAATDIAREHNQETLARGIRMRSVVTDAALRTPGSLDYLNWLSGLGAEVRTVPTLPSRLIVVDRRIAVLPLDPAGGGADAVQVTVPGVITLLVALFEAVWESAEPLGTEPTDVPEPTGGLSRQEHALLRLLAQGLTDESAAQRLGLSVRTVRRTASALMARLGARSRFEAGLRAKERGWL